MAIVSVLSQLDAKLAFVLYRLLSLKYLFIHVSGPRGLHDFFNKQL